MALQLKPDEQEMLDGANGPAVAMAMQVVCALAEVAQATELIDVEHAHIDSCLFHGQAGLDFAERLVELGGKVSIPTTLNVGSLDLLHPHLVRNVTPDEQEITRGGRALMQAYLALGAKATWTCAPYQNDARPAVGVNIAWAESNAIVFANSVLGARTDRYGDFLDICSAITGKAPNAGLHLPVNRLADLIIDVSACSEATLSRDITYPLLGYLAGTLAGTRNPVFVGVPSSVSEDQLKALGAAAASSGGVALFHVVGRTPEAPDLPSVTGGRELPVHKIGPAELIAARAELNTAKGVELDAISLGTPHASVGEIAELAELLEGRHEPLAKPIYVSTGRTAHQICVEKGIVAPLEALGVIFVLDTCTYITSILDPSTRVVMTNSGKWAHYAPGNLGIDVVIATLGECVDSAIAGAIRMRDDLFS